MKNQALFSSKDKSKKLKCRLLQFLYGTLRVNYHNIISPKAVEMKSADLKNMLEPDEAAHFELPHLDL